MINPYNNSEINTIRGHAEYENIDYRIKNKQAQQANYKFPDYLNNNINFMQVVKMMSHVELSRFVYFVGIMADEKEELDSRHFASDQLNVFLNELLNRGAS